MATRSTDALPPESELPRRGAIARETYELRERAEAIATERAAAPHDVDGASSPEATARAIHELRVHQVELELQNEELRRAHLELDDLRARYFDLYEQAPVGYCIVSGQGLIEEANLTAATLLGTPRAALTGKSIYGFVVREDRDRFYLLRKHLLRGEPSRIAWELRMLKGDGSHFWARIEATAARSTGDLQALRVVIVDVSDRKRAEVALTESERVLRLSEAQMQMAQEIGHTGSWVYDVETERGWASAEGFRIFGYPPVARFCSLDEIERCIPERDRVHRALDALLGEGRAYDLEYLIHPADGAPPRMLHSVARLERDDLEAPLAVVGFVQDVTESREAQAKLQRLAGALTEANRLKDVFTDVLRHDILNPVGAIKLSIELLLEQESDAQKSRVLRRARQSAMNLVEMTENAAKLALVVAGEASQFVEADPVAVLRLVLPDFEHKLREKGMTLADHACSEGIRACFNPILKDVFANLISNAIKYSPADSQIDLAIGKHGESWVFSVLDRGPGVPDEYKKSVFNRFERLDKKGVKGSGLGLAITKEIVIVHGGEIWVEDAPGGGSRFVVRLPLNPPGRNEAT